MTWQIDIRQTFGRIGIQYNAPQWEIKTQPAEQDIQTQPPDIEIQIVPGNLTIDQSDAFAQEGDQKPLEFARSQANDARQAVLAGIARQAQIGQQVSHAKSKAQVVDIWSMQKAFHVQEAVPALVPAPFSVHIQYELGHVYTRVQVGEVEEHVTVHRPQVAFQPGAVKTYIDQQASLTIIPPSDHNYVV